MPIIKLNATDSTNVYLKKLALSQPVEDYTVVSTALQFKGRGQMGSQWTSEEFKNLTISILRKLEDFKVENQFDLNCVVSMAIYHTLNEMTVPNLSVKWPNDILSGNQKICGILIENILRGRQINLSVIGIGLNVNQTDFENLENATSIKAQLGDDFDLDELILQILNKLKYYFSLSRKEIRESYTEKLFKKDKPATFRTIEGKLFVGFIRGVDDAGHLLVEIENTAIKKFGLKEISMIY